MSDAAQDAPRGASPLPGAGARAIAIDGALSGIAGTLVLALGLDVGDRLAGSSGFAPALLGSALLHGPAPGPGAPAGHAIGGPGQVAIGYLLLALVAFPIGAVLSWWAGRQPRFPSSGSAWLAAAVGLGLGLLALDRATASHLVGELGPWRILGAIAPAAVAIPLVIWQRQPRLIQNRRNLADDEP